MKKNLLGTTALVGAAVVGGAAAIVGGAAVVAAEAPTWKLSGNMNFQFYNIDQDFNWVERATSDDTWDGVAFSSTWAMVAPPSMEAPEIQDHGWYFGVDEAELTLNVDGTADNGLSYGFKVEIQTNTTDGTVADEARISLSGGWGTLHLGDEDGAEDTMNYGGENLMGATGGFDGDFDDVLLRRRALVAGIEQIGAASYPTITGDTGDSTKVTYYSPRFSGFQVGASVTPTPNDGDNFKADGDWENHYGLGANYDNTFGNLHVQASAVYSARSSNSTGFEDVAAWSVGGIVGFGPFSLGANYTDNGDSGSPALTASPFTSESSYWNVAAGFETGPLYFSAGYFSSTREFSGEAAADWGMGDSTFENIALTVDYTAAPGLGFYAEIDLISDEYLGTTGDFDEGWQVDCSESGIQQCSNDATIFIMGVNVSF